MNDDFFESVRAGDSAPGVAADRIDVAVLDMNHSWPNVGHDSVVRAIREAAAASQALLRESGVKVRAISFDVRRSELLPDGPDGRFSLYIGTGGPGHLDPRLNDGVSQWAQGVDETPAWEAPLFRLFDSILHHPDAALIGICHSFGLMCRWSGVARPVLREKKSSGLMSNVLSESAAHHPWFSRFAGALPDHRHFRVIDNRLFDLVLDDPSGVNCLAFENENSAAVTMLEFARDSTGAMPRVFGMNHHPEIIDRQHVLEVLNDKRTRGEVSEEWYRERAGTMDELLQGENERQARLTSEYTFLGPLRHWLGDVAGSRSPVAGTS